MITKEESSSNEIPLTQAEIDAWTRSIGSNDMRRINAIYSLLRHANEDGMSESDREICKEVLAKLRLKRSKDQANTRPVAGTSQGTSVGQVTEGRAGENRV